MTEQVAHRDLRNRSAEIARHVAMTAPTAAGSRQGSGGCRLTHLQPGSACL